VLAALSIRCCPNSDSTILGSSIHERTPRPRHNGQEIKLELAKKLGPLKPGDPLHGGQIGSPSDYERILWKIKQEVCQRFSQRPSRIRMVKNIIIVCDLEIGRINKGLEKELGEVVLSWRILTSVEKLTEGSIVREP